MLHIIGISKCKKDSLYFFDKQFIQKSIIFNNAYDNIVSFIVSHEILDINIIDSLENNKNIYDNNFFLINIFFKINYKIIYSNKDSKNLQIHYDTSYSSALVKVPCFIEGRVVSQMLKSKKLKFNLYIEDVNINNLSNKNLLIESFIIIDIEYIKSHTLSYIVKQNHTQENIFISFDNGAQLTQKTFNINCSYSHLQWSLFGSDLVYLQHKLDKTILCISNVGAKLGREIILDIELKEINSFCFIDSENIVLSGKEYDKFELYKINIHNNNMDKILNYFQELNYIDPSYCIYNKLLFFIEKNISGYNICSMDLNLMSISYIKEYENIIKYTISYRGDYIAALSNNKDDTPMIALTQVMDGTTQEINGLHHIKKVKHMEFSNKEDILILVLNDLKTDNIFTFELDTFKLTNITKFKNSTHISSISLDSNNNTVIYTAKQSNFYSVYCIDLNDFETTKIIANSFEEITCEYKRF